MKLTHFALIGAFVFVGLAQAQGQRGEEDRAVARACRADAEHMCSGKTGQEMKQCLQANKDKLSSNCKEAMSKLPQQPKS